MIKTHFRFDMISNKHGVHGVRSLFMCWVFSAQFLPHPALGFKGYFTSSKVFVLFVYKS